MSPKKFCIEDRFTDSFIRKTEFMYRVSNGEIQVQHDNPSEIPLQWLTGYSTGNSRVELELRKHLAGTDLEDLSINLDEIVDNLNLEERSNSRNFGRKLGAILTAIAIPVSTGLIYLGSPCCINTELVLADVIGVAYTIGNQVDYSRISSLLQEKL